MPTWLELLLLAVASMFWPTLILVDVVALRLAKPIGILAWFLAGGLLTTITIGTLLVFALQGHTAVTTAPESTHATVSIVAGVLSLVAASLLRRRSPKPRTKPSRVERVVEHGGVVAFLGGVVLNVVPGTFPLVALADIAQLDLSNAATVATIAVFYVIMFAFVEVPLVTYVFAPERTTAAVAELNAQLARNGQRLGVGALVVVGLYLIVRGVVQLVA